MKRDMDLDGNAIAELQFDHAQSEAQRDFDLLGPSVVEELVDDLMNHRKVERWRLADFLVNEDFSELLARLSGADSDTRTAIVDEIIAREEKVVRKWIENSPDAAMIVEDRVRDALEEQG
jgi:activator of HSP90 ATPase